VVVLRHVPVQVVGVGRRAGGKLKALGGVARIGNVCWRGKTLRGKAGT
jgi:hypothetical protein